MASHLPADAERRTALRSTSAMGGDAQWLGEFRYRHEPGARYAGGGEGWFARGPGHHPAGSERFRAAVRLRLHAHEQDCNAVLTTDSVTPTILLSQGLPPNLVTPQNASNIQTSSYDRHLRHGYAEQWSYSLQRELPGDMLLEVGYYANAAHKLMRRTEGN